MRIHNPFVDGSAFCLATIIVYFVCFEVMFAAIHTAAMQALQFQSA